VRTRVARECSFPKRVARTGGGKHHLGGFTHDGSFKTSILAS
jgi:hypothetical protein